jgi:hypothetical protein
VAAIVTNVNIMSRVAVAYGFFEDVGAAAIGTDAIVIGG